LNGTAPFQFLRMEPLRSTFGKRNEAAPFFVWLESAVERNHSIPCLVGEPFRSIWIPAGAGRRRGLEIVLRVRVRVPLLLRRRAAEELDSPEKKAEEWKPVWRA
jgi:hypothetical protein